MSSFSICGVRQIYQKSASETQEFPRFLSPPIAGSSSVFLESEHLYSFYSWFPPLQLSPLSHHCYHCEGISTAPPPPCILLLLNSMPETSPNVAYLLFPIYISYFFLLRISLQSLGRQSIGRNLVSSQLCATGCSSQRKKRVSQTPSCRSLGMPWLHGATLLQVALLPLPVHTNSSFLASPGPVLPLLPRQLWGVNWNFI